MKKKQQKTFWMILIVALAIVSVMVIYFGNNAIPNNKQNDTGNGGITPECVVGETKCENQVYFYCEGEGFWKNYGLVDGLCGYSGGSSECSPGSEKCKNYFYYDCVGSGVWRFLGFIEGKCGYTSDTKLDTGMTCIDDSQCKSGKCAYFQCT